MYILYIGIAPSFAPHLTAFFLPLCIYVYTHIFSPNVLSLFIYICTFCISVLLQASRGVLLQLVCLLTATSVCLSSSLQLYIHSVCMFSLYIYTQLHSIYLCCSEFRATSNRTLCVCFNMHAFSSYLFSLYIYMYIPCMYVLLRVSPRIFCPQCLWFISETPPFEWVQVQFYLLGCNNGGGGGIFAWNPPIPLLHPNTYSSQCLLLVFPIYLHMCTFNWNGPLPVSLYWLPYMGWLRLVGSLKW